MREESAAVGDLAGSSPAGAPGREILGGRWAFGLASGLLLLFAAVEGAHAYALWQNIGFEQVMQQPVPISSPASHPDISAPDPGDNP